MNFISFTFIYWALALILFGLVVFPEASEKIINKIIGGLKKCYIIE